MKNLDNAKRATRVFAVFILLLLLLHLPLASYAAGPAITGEAVDKGEQKAEPPEGSEPTDEEFAEEKTIADPLEGFNRAMFTVNDRLYFWVLKPVATGYNKVMPEWGRVRVRNIFRNAAMPIRFVNCVLQLKFHSAVKEIGRFIVNTTGGVGGMFDVLADNPNAQMSDRDLGQTFGKYGIGDGFYLILPLLGPSSLRDAAGRAGDGFLDPFSYLPTWGEKVGVTGYRTVNDTSLTLGQYEDFKAAAIDPYTAMKNAYFQHRQSKLEE